MTGATEIRRRRTRSRPVLTRLPAAATANGISNPSADLNFSLS
jgi:hypothetical protein